MHVLLRRCIAQGVLSSHGALDSFWVGVLKNRDLQVCGYVCGVWVCLWSVGSNRSDIHALHIHRVRKFSLSPHSQSKAQSWIAMMRKWRVMKKMMKTS